MEHTGSIQTMLYSTAIYCRLSKDDEQAGDSTSIQTQKMMLEKYCSEQGFPVHGVYVDDGYSGLNFDRPDFQRMLNDIDNGRINLVVTKDLSRLGRDYIQTGYYTDIYFSRKKVRYIAVNDGVDTNRDDNDIAPFKNILNDMYAKDLSRKVKSAKRQRAYSGYYISAQAPYGYKVNPANKNQLIVDKEPAAVVIEMFRLALDGSSTLQITKSLTERKIMNPSSYKAKNGDTRFDRYNNNEDESSVFRWCNETVQQILRNRVYVGDMENRKYEIANYKTKERVKVPQDQHIVVENTHEALVSREDFNTVQGFIKMRHKPYKHNFNNIFKSIVFCSECSGRFTLAMKPKKDGVYPLLLCRRHFLDEQRCQHYHYIYYNDLYEIVLAKIKGVASRVESGELMRSISADHKWCKNEKLDKEIFKVNSRLTVLKKITKKLYEDYACDLLDEDSYRRMLSEYQQEQRQLMQRQGTIQAELDKKDDYSQNLQKLADTIKTFLNFEELNTNMINQLVERIEVDYPKIVNGERQQEVTIIYRFIETSIQD